ncbi:hypothetical protein ACIQXD_25645 [Streptomyces uncialis]|uniref:hypothetical protein n=1 Tax=Streptomyces uncialis TaxID=1048205 RepID=UPI0037F3299C
MSAAGVFCCRCDGVIGAGEAYEDLLRHSMSGPGARVQRHVRCPGEDTGAGSRDPAVLEAVHYVAWGRLMTHLGACPECLSDDPWDCPTGRRLRKEWRTAERDTR